MVCFCYKISRRTRGMFAPRARNTPDATDAVLFPAAGAAIVMFVAGRPCMDAVALLVMVMLPFTGVVTMSEALAGFSDPSIVLDRRPVRRRRGTGAHWIACRVGDWLIPRRAATKPG